LPLEGIMPLAPSMDHPGPMAHDVMDMAFLLRAMLEGDSVEPYTNFVENAAVARNQPQLGRIRQLFEDRAAAPVREMMDEICQRFSEDGAVVQEVSLPGEFSDIIQQHRTVMAVEAAKYHQSRLQRHPDDYAPRIKQLVEEGSGCPAPEYARTKEHQAKLTMTMRMMMRDPALLICPATPGPAPLADTTGDPAFNSPWSYTGLPTISIQTGYFVDGLPLALQLVAGPNREDLLFSVAAWCEKRLAPSPLVPKFPQ
jgi:aspartyl-tRNA(Asn)/glutamyl-tRNA(Gln) amidotransferase subunit A